MRRRTYATSPPVRTHNGVLDSIRNLSSHADIRPRTDNWVTPDLIMDPGSDSLLFVDALLISTLSSMTLGRTCWRSSCIDEVAERHGNPSPIIGVRTLLRA